MHDLLSPPWWLSVLVLIVGVILFYFGNANRKSAVRLAGAVVLLLAVVMFLLGYFVETDLEKTRRLTRELVAAVPAKNWVTMTNLLDPDASLWVASAQSALYSGRDNLVGGAKASADRWTIKSVGITSIKSTPDGSGNILVDIDTMADSDAAMGYKAPSSWRFTWDKTGDEWHVHKIECTKLGNASGAEINSMIGK
jgi:hypothetical protein